MYAFVYLHAYLGAYWVMCLVIDIAGGSIQYSPLIEDMLSWLRNKWARALLEIGTQQLQHHHPHRSNPASPISNNDAFTN